MNPRPLLGTSGRPIRLPITVIVAAKAARSNLCGVCHCLRLVLAYSPYLARISGATLQSDDYYQAVVYNSRSIPVDACCALYKVCILSTHIAFNDTQNDVYVITTRYFPTMRIYVDRYGMLEDWSMTRRLIPATE